MATSMSTARSAGARWPAPRTTRTARIFALTFDPELVAIAGFYAVRENLGEVPKARAVQVRLQGEQMRFEALG